MTEYLVTVADGENPTPRADTDDQLPAEVRAQLRPVAESMAQLFGGDVDLAEEAVMQSALELTRDATVFKYAPVLAARRARRRRQDPPSDTPTP
jgi:hypothetical protein